MMQPNQLVEIKSTAAPGQAIRAALVAEDRSNGAAAEAVPFPIEDTDKSCKLQVLLGLTDADMVVVQGSGFPADSTLKMDTITGANQQTLDAKSNAAGRLAFVVMPRGEKGQASGTTTVRFTGVLHPPTLAATPAKPAAPDPDCAPAVSFPWGTGSYKPE